MKKALFIAPFLALAAPLAASAQDLSGIAGFILQVRNILEFTLPIAITLAVLFFFWGLAQYIWNAGDDGAKEEGRNKMIWGVIALFVIVSVWGIIGFLGELFGINQGGSAPVPGVNPTEETGGIPGGGNNGGGGTTATATTGGTTFPTLPPPTTGGTL